MNKLKKSLCVAAVAGAMTIPFTAAQALVGTLGWWTLGR